MRMLELIIWSKVFVDNIADGLAYGEHYIHRRPRYILLQRSQ